MQLFCDKIFSNCMQFYSKDVLELLVPTLSNAAIERVSGLF
jgi:hypothetical protein